MYTRGRVVDGARLTLDRNSNGGQDDASIQLCRVIVSPDRLQQTTVVLCRTASEHVHATVWTVGSGGPNLRKTKSKFDLQDGVFGGAGTAAVFKCVVELDGTYMPP